MKKNVYEIVVDNYEGDDDNRIKFVIEAHGIDGPDGSLGSEDIISFFDYVTLNDGNIDQLKHENKFDKEYKLPKYKKQRVFFIKMSDVLYIKMQGKKV